MSRHKNTAGFTIIELMIATAVFSVVLLVVTGAIIGIGRLYTKGSITARTQDVARSVAESIAQTVQLTPGPPPTPPIVQSGVYSFCADTQQYSYKLGQQIGGNTHGLVFHTVQGGCATSTPNMSVSDGGTELLGDKMRLANLSVTPDPNNDRLYNIQVRVVYGDNDLLCNETALPGSCSRPGDLSSTDITRILADPANLRCKNGGSGNEFCAMSELSTMVERRMQQ